MARLCREHSPYGCGHHDEHVRAARLGWLRRRGHTAFSSPQESAWLARVVGEVRGAHVHTSHPNTIAFKQGRRWYEVPRPEFKRLIRAGRDIEQDERREKAARIAEERAIAQYRRAEEQDRRRAEMERTRAERYTAFQERQVRGVQRAHRAEVVSIIKSAGGIRLASKQDRGEYALLPSELRRRTGRVTLDEARLLVNEEMPWLQLDTPDDLVQFFERSRVTRTQQQHQKRLRKAS